MQTCIKQTYRSTTVQRRCFTCVTGSALTLTAHADRAASPAPSKSIWKSTYHPECSFTSCPCAVYFVYP